MSLHDRNQRALRQISEHMIWEGGNVPDDDGPWQTDSDVEQQMKERYQLNMRLYTRMVARSHKSNLGIMSLDLLLQVLTDWGCEPSGPYTEYKTLGVSQYITARWPNIDGVSMRFGIDVIPCIVEQILDRSLEKDSKEIVEILDRLPDGD